ncbi:hypothetical protein ACFLUZ_06120 [Chloroflexota bacterium]
MLWLVALMMLLFYGLAVCTIGGMVTSGISAGLAIATAVLEVTLGIIIVRVMYSEAKRV